MQNCDPLKFSFFFSYLNFIAWCDFDDWEGKSAFSSLRINHELPKQQIKIPILTFRTFHMKRDN